MQKVLEILSDYEKNGRISHEDHMSLSLAFEGFKELFITITSLGVHQEVIVKSKAQIMGNVCAMILNRPNLNDKDEELISSEFGKVLDALIPA